MRKIILTTLVIAAVICTLVVMGTVVSSRSVRAAQTSTQQEKKYKGTRAIVVDKQTGQVRLPTEQETQDLVNSLAAMINTSTQGLQETTLPNGAKAIELNGRFASVALTRPNADRTTETRCVSSFAEAAEFLGLEEDGGQ